jgi:hypothetical protein
MDGDVRSVLGKPSIAEPAFPTPDCSPGIATPLKIVYAGSVLLDA